MQGLRLEPAFWEAVAGFLISEGKESSLPHYLGICPPRGGGEGYIESWDCTSPDSYGKVFQQLSFGSVLRALVLGLRQPTSEQGLKPVFVHAHEQMAGMQTTAQQQLGVQQFADTLRLGPIGPLVHCEFLLRKGTGAAAVPADEPGAQGCHSDTIRHRVTTQSTITITSLLSSCLAAVQELQAQSCLSSGTAARVLLTWGPCPQAPAAAEPAHALQAAAAASSSPYLTASNTLPVTLEAAPECALEVAPGSCGPPARSRRDLTLSRASAADATFSECSPWEGSDLATQSSFGPESRVLEACGLLASQASLPSHEPAKDASTHNSSPGFRPRPPKTSTQPDEASRGRRRPKLTLTLATDRQAGGSPSSPVDSANHSKSSGLRIVSRATSVASGISSIGSVRSQSQQDAMLAFQRTPSAEVSFELSPASVKLDQDFESAGGFPSKAATTAEAVQQRALQSSATPPKQQPPAATEKGPPLRLPLLTSQPKFSLGMPGVGASRFKLSRTTTSKLQTPPFRGLRHLQTSPRPSTAPHRLLNVVSVKAATVGGILRHTSAVRKGPPSAYGPVGATRNYAGTTARYPASSRSRQTLSAAMAGASGPAHLHSRATRGPAVLHNQRKLREALVSACDDRSDVWVPARPAAPIGQGMFSGTASHMSIAPFTKRRLNQQKRVVRFSALP